MSDTTTRKAALWATLIAVPVAVLVGWVAVTQIFSTDELAAAPAPSASAPLQAIPGTPVEMAAPELNERDTTVCLAVTSQLPAQVRNLPARKVSAGPEQNAAYGEPPLTVACGVERPVMCETVDGGAGCVPLDTELLLMDRVCWYAESTATGAVLTTMDREVPVRVTVPTGLENPAQWANEFSAAIAGTDRRVEDGVPSGCA